MSEIPWGSAFMRALNGEYSRGVRRLDTSGVMPDRAIHTKIHDDDLPKLKLLEPLTAYEMRVFRQDGMKGVVEFRRWTARENGVKDWKEVGRSRYGIRPGVNVIVREDNDERLESRLLQEERPQE